MSALRSFARSLGSRRKTLKRLLIVLGVNAVVFVAVTYRLGNKQQRLASELAELDEQVDQKRAELETLSAQAERASTNAEIVSEFWSDTVRSRAPGLTEAWDEIDKLASETHVVRGRTSYNRELLEVGLEHVEAKMPVEGTYFDLVRFINRLERSDRFFLVEEVKLSKRAQEEATLQLDCSLSFYLRPDAAVGD